MTLRDIQQHRYIWLALAALSISSCGTLTPEQESTPTNSPQWQNAATQALPTEQQSTSTRIVVKFTQESQVQLVDDLLTSTRTETTHALEALRKFNLQARHALPLDPKIFARAQRRAQREGFTLTHWPSIMIITGRDNDQEAPTLEAMRNLSIVEWAYPMPQPLPDRPPQDLHRAQTTKAVPDISGEQGYLTAEPGGLNISAAWDRGLFGAGQTVINFETNWNFSHADLPIDITTTPIGAANDPVFAGIENEQHGTATLGIIGASHNGLGIQGIAPNATLRTAAVPYVYSDFPFITLLWAFEDFAFGKAIGGHILLDQIGIPGPNTQSYIASGDYATLTDCPGCLPSISDPTIALVFADLVNMGIIVIDGAGNGAISLEDPNERYPWSVDLSAEDNGILLVGASTGADMMQAPFANCGTRVNVFAWGQDVVTTGYGNHPASVLDDPNQWYVHNFNGVSAASPMIAGIVAILQEHVDELYADQVQPWEHVFLNAAQVRAILTHPSVGSPPSDNNDCGIGVQPDLGAALDLLDSGVITPKIVAKGSFCQNTESPECQNICAEDPLSEEANCGLICDANPQHELCAQWCQAKADVPLSGFYPEQQCKDTFHPNAKLHDVDADGRADIIAWSGEEQRWYVDRSNSNPTQTEDGFGEWDLVLDVATALDPGRIFPVVQDYNSDGHADLALYNSDTGIWRIQHTRDSWLTHEYSVGNWVNWDVEIDDSNHPEWQAGSRPFAGEFNRSYSVRSTSLDHAEIIRPTDRALVTPKGEWLLAMGEDHHKSSINLVHSYLTTDHLNAAPGWAYLPIASPSYASGVRSTRFKAPDGISEQNIILSTLYGPQPDAPVIPSSFPYDFGSNSRYFVSASFLFENYANASFGIRDTDGTWTPVNLMYGENFSGTTTPGLGDVTCRPVGADYDGDSINEPAALCADGTWRMASTAAQDNAIRIIEYGTPTLALPAEVHVGGIAYQDIINAYAPVNFGCPPEQACSIFDLPAPTGPGFAQCVTENETDILQCLDL